MKGEEFIGNLYIYCEYHCLIFNHLKMKQCCGFLERSLLIHLFNFTAEMDKKPKWGRAGVNVKKDRVCTKD